MRGIDAGGQVGIGAGNRACGRHMLFQWDRAIAGAGCHQRRSAMGGTDRRLLGDGG